MFLSKVRGFFEEFNYLEVHSPTLVVSPGSEPFLDFFETKVWQGSAPPQLRFLPSSPELSLKKLLALDVGNLFEIRTCFRNNEGSPLHRPEFFMLEWYSVGLNFEQMLQFTHQFFSQTARAYLQSQGKDLPIWLPKNEIKKYSIAELFKTLLQFDLSPQTSAKELLKLTSRWGLVADEQWGFDDLFHLLMIEKVEPFLQTQGLVFVTHYPPSQAAQAKLNAQGWAERFEVYAQGVELANAYHELTNVTELRERVKIDNLAREKLGRPQTPIDEEFFTAVSQLPQVSGIALGLERWFMLLEGKKEIHFWSPLWKSYSR